ncbi:MAG: anhydro-N-acetylmuramic acid kinase [Candidatus Bipolaricaulia bacterium]
MLVIGLMSGTSMDGITAALVEIEEKKLGEGVEPELMTKLIELETYPYPPELKRQLLILRESGTVEELCCMDFYLGELFAQAALKVMEKAGKSSEEIDLIGSHGQTICHHPQGLEGFEFSAPSTLQLGEIDVIAERTGITTIGDFRPKDLAAGGEGAPLIPYADYHLFHDPEKHRAILNIGGIANITYLPAGAKLNEIIAFDTGPGNMVIDGVLRRLTGDEQAYDKNGEIAAKGRVNQRLLQELMDYPFINRRPPKSTGREEFGEGFLDRLMKRAHSLRLSDEDLVATVTAFTTEAIAENCRRFLGRIDELIVGGGGAYNRTLLQMLEERFKGVYVATTQAYGIPVEAKEALGFALLAYQASHHRANNVPSATGAKHPVVLGKISWGIPKGQQCAS